MIQIFNLLKIDPQISESTKGYIYEAYEKVNALWPIHHKVTFIYNTGKTRNGYCKKHNSRNYTIAINKDIVKKEDIICVSIHELLHSYPEVWSDGHKGEWKQRAAFVNQIYGLNIKRCNTYQRSKTYSKRPVKYLIHCTKCHHEWNYRRTPKWINHLEKVTCPFCHTHTIQADTVVSIDEYKL